MYSDSLDLSPLRSILPPQLFWCSDCRKLWSYAPTDINPDGSLDPEFNNRMVQLTERTCQHCMEDVPFNPYWVIVRGIEKAKRRSGRP